MNRSHAARGVARALAVLLVLAAVPWRAAAEETAAASQPADLQGLKRLKVSPEVAYIRGVGGRHALLFTGVFEDGSERDVTPHVTLSFDSPGILEQASPGLFEARKEGFVKLRAALGDVEAESAVIVQPKRNLKIDFGTGVAPVFSKHGCNNSNCHGALNGQNGFKLSLFGYDPDADYEAVVHASGGRRVNLESPEESLLLQKPTFAISHGGGLLIEKEDLDYQILLNWIRQGAHKSAGRERPRLIKLDVYPNGFQTLDRPGDEQRIVVAGHYSDGSQEDLTRKVRYSTGDDTVIEVSEEGRVAGIAHGEGTVLIRTLGHVAALRFGVAREEAVPAPAHEPANFIDEFIFDKLDRMNIEVSGFCTDSEFIRRAYLDIIGVVPPAEETRRFLEDDSPGKRRRLVDELLRRPEYADFWALKWGDLFANSVLTSSDGTAYQQDWLRSAFRENKPYDQFVTEVLTATGSSWKNGAVNYFSRSKEEVVTLTGQAFLGLSLECARCHDHPSATWKRDDFLAMTAFFSQVSAKGQRPPPTENIKYIVYDQEFRHPETKQVVKPRFLDGTEPVIRPLQDRRQVLADWITSPDNRWFARATVNRFWNQFMGHGLVDPVDDFRATNPPSHAELLDRLAGDFIEHGYDLHHLIRRITSSKAYQLSSAPTPSNREDAINYSRFFLKRLTAEQLMDSIVQVTGIPQDYLGYYPGARAVNLADPGVPSSFLDMYDRSKRDAAKCERNESVSLRQAMHSLAGDTINEKVKLSSERGVIAERIEQGASDGEIIEHLFLAALSRYPEPREKDYCLTVLGRADSRRRGLENVLWAILNTNEFLYNH